MPGDLTKRWVGPVIYGVLGLELTVVTVAAAYNALDFAPPPPGQPGRRDEASLTRVQVQQG